MDQPTTTATTDGTISVRVVPYTEQNGTFSPNNMDEEYTDTVATRTRAANRRRVISCQETYKLYPNGFHQWSVFITNRNDPDDEASIHLEVPIIMKQSNDPTYQYGVPFVPDDAPVINRTPRRYVIYKSQANTFEVKYRLEHSSGHSGVASFEVTQKSGPAGGSVSTEQVYQSIHYQGSQGIIIKIARSNVLLYSFVTSLDKIH